MGDMTHQESEDESQNGWQFNDSTYEWLLYREGKVVIRVPLESWNDWYEGYKHSFGLIPIV